MNPVGALLLTVLLCTVALGGRRAALLAMMGGVLFLTQGQSLAVGGLRFYAIRILGMAMMCRVIGKREFLFSRLNQIDVALITLYAYNTSIFVLRSETGQVGSVAEALDAFCCYFGFRGLIRSEKDFRWLLGGLVTLLIPYSVFLAVERTTGRNLFSFLGGVIEGGFERDGKPRCMGSFRYAVTLGTFAATFLALYVGVAVERGRSYVAWVGIGLCLWVIFVTNSGGSYTAALAVVVAWLFWRSGANMRAVRWGIVWILLALHLVMKPPVWYIFAKASVITGGDGWHRSYLIDVALDHLNRWWLFGMPVTETADWFPYTVNGGADITNQYLLFGLNSGLVSTLLFVWLISRVFGRIGQAIKKLGRTETRTAPARLLLWGLGAAMTAHTISFFGVTYFDQIYVIWFLHLAIAASLTDSVLRIRQFDRSISSTVGVDASRSKEKVLAKVKNRLATYRGAFFAPPAIFGRLVWRSNC